MDWLTSNEAAAYLKINPRTLAEWARKGKVPGHRLSGARRYTWRFLQSELDAMLTADTCPSEASLTVNSRSAGKRAGLLSD
jgi:excisionase family DNA binding protein